MGAWRSLQPGFARCGRAGRCPAPLPECVFAEGMRGRMAGTPALAACLLAVWVSGGGCCRAGAAAREASSGFVAPDKDLPVCVGVRACVPCAPSSACVCIRLSACPLACPSACRPVCLRAAPLLGQQTSRRQARGVARSMVVGGCSAHVEAIRTPPTDMHTARCCSRLTDVVRPRWRLSAQARVLLALPCIYLAACCPRPASADWSSARLAVVTCKNATLAGRVAANMSCCQHRRERWR